MCELYVYRSSVTRHSATAGGIRDVMVVVVCSLSVIRRNRNEAYEHKTGDSPENANHYCYLLNVAFHIV